MFRPLDVSEAPVSTPPELRALYARPLPSSRTGPLYNAFSYPTKISPEAIAVYIATHTQPGAVVLDTFAGSGTTGLAAKLCDQPTPEMLRMVKNLGVKPTWGPRDAILYELSVIGSFVAQVMCNPPQPSSFEVEANALLSDAYERLAPILEAKDDQGQVGVLRHAIWSEIVLCPECGHEQSLWDAAVEQTPLRLRTGDEPVRCPGCQKAALLKRYPRATERLIDETLGTPIERRKRVLVRVYGKTEKRNWSRSPQASDHKVAAQIEECPIPKIVPVVKLILGDLYRSGYHLGITHLHHLYTRRNLITIATLLELIEQRAPEMRDALRLLVLSYNQSHSTLMTRVVIKSGHSDFVLTGAQSGVLYISGFPVEKNIIEGLKRKIKPLRDSFALVEGSRSTVIVRNQSSTSLKEDCKSVDYCFTDPPFADFIPYSEINQINELWLGRTTDRTHEAVVSVAQNKSISDYRRMMSSVFQEISRVLKDDGMMTVVFHAAKASVWGALQQAYRAAKLEVTASSVLDKLQASFKQVVSTVSVKGDPLLLLTKQKGDEAPSNDIGEPLLRDLIEQAKRTGNTEEYAIERLYSRYVNRCLEDGISVKLDAKEFYRMVQINGVQ